LFRVLVASRLSGGDNPGWIEYAAPYRTLRAIALDLGEVKPRAMDPALLNPLIALVAGVLILLMPRTLNYVVAIYLIAIGIIGLAQHLQ
jgi:hypothetical protein